MLCQPKEVGHKPNLIVSVSAGHGGAFPISELRTSSYKNNKLCHIPDHVIIQKVNKVIGDIEQKNFDSYILQRLKWSVYVLLQYANAMQKLSIDSLLFDERYENGM